MWDWLNTTFGGILQWLQDMIVAIFTAAWDFIKDGACWVFESILKVAISALSALDLSGLNVQAWGSIPGDIVNIMQLLGIGTAVSIILAAVAIRLALQLIPFTRLGS